jgi:gamma-glutamyltranspeptidase / glutathione hydrolase
MTTSRIRHIAGLLAAVLVIVTAAFALYAQRGVQSAEQETALELTRPAVPGRHGLVTAGHPLASSAGLQILLKGGNAFDAAVAVGAMLNLTEPEMNGIGGNGFITVFDKKSGKVYSLSMAGAAPNALRPAEMTPETLGSGVMAGIVQGNLGGYLYALERFGTMSLAQVLASAIEYAETGYPIDPKLAQSISRGSKTLAKYPTSAKVFMPEGRPLAAGEIFRNPDLAGTLRKLVEAERQALDKGASRSAAIRAAFDRFYKGDIAQEVERFFKANGGLLTAADLAAYQPQWTEPVHTSYRGFDVYSNPSTSRGGFEVTMQANLVEGFDLKGADRAKATHLMIEAIKVAKSDIYRYVADPKFTSIPTAGLLSKDYAVSRRALIDASKAITYPEPGRPAGVSSTVAQNQLADARLASVGHRAFVEDYDREEHTTSFSIVDSSGNAVGCTPTLGGLFGNGVVVGNTGMLLNNGMRLGSTSPYPDNVNYVGAGKVPILNNSPVVVLKDGKLAFVFGTPGGETIGQTQFQVLVNLIDFEMPIQYAIESPRVSLAARPNFYRPGSEVEVTVEGRFSPTTVKALEAMGHKVRVTDGFGSIGNIQGIKVDFATGTMMAGSDPRRTAYAMGY